MPQELIAKSVRAAKALLTRKVNIECDRVPHEFFDVPLKKIMNWILVEASSLVRPARPLGWPTHLQIEPSSFCNIRCALCPVTEGLNRPSGHMNEELFKRLIDECGEYLFLILFWDWGEPFLNPAAYKMISYAKERNIKIMSSSNGHIFSRKSQAEKLVLSGMDSLVFAVDGITQETYEKYRQGGDLQAVIRGIKNVVDMKRALKSPSPFIVLRFIAMRHNEHEIPKVKDFARSLGVDALTFRTLYPYDDGEYCSTKLNGLEFVPQNPSYQRFKIDPEGGSRIRRRRNPCKALWNNPAIHWNGRVCPCTFDPHEQYLLGDLTKQSFREIWYGNSYRRLRHRFRRNYQDVPLCRECTNAFEGGTCSTEDIVEAYFFTNAQ